jgi:hypothetical protein
VKVFPSCGPPFGAVKLARLPPQLAIGSALPQRSMRKTPERPSDRSAPKIT